MKRGESEDSPSEGGGFTCPRCSKHFRAKRYLVSHSKRCKGRKTTCSKFLCNLCGKCFGKNSHYQRHYRHHYDVREYNCEKCGQNFVQRSHLKRHVNMVHKPGLSDLSDHKCPHCGKGFGSQWQVNRHVRQVHSAWEGGSMECMICDRADFATPQERERHLQQHMGLRPFVCDHCSAAFARNTELKCHLASKHHVGEMFACSQCRRAFPQRTQIDRHLKTCHSAFSDSGHLLCPAENPGGFVNKRRVLFSRVTHTRRASGGLVHSRRCNLSASKQLLSSVQDSGSLTDEHDALPSGRFLRIEQDAVDQHYSHDFARTSDSEESVSSVYWLSSLEEDDGGEELCVQADHPDIARTSVDQRPTRNRSFYKVDAKQVLYSGDRPPFTTATADQAVTAGTNSGHSLSPPPAAPLHPIPEMVPCPDTRPSSRMIRVVVKIGEGFKSPLSTLELGPALPTLLLDVCPDFRVVEVKASGKTFHAGETVVIDLPIQSTSAAAACLPQCINLVYEP